MVPQPLVTGVSPKEGPPGTRITIRGENLGRDLKDLIGLKICGVDCLLSAEWKSSSKIIARTGSGKGKGDIIVSTKSGGTGSCTVGFRGFFVQIGPLQESAVWIDETQTVLNQLGRRGNTSPLAAKDDDDPLGISDEGNKQKSEEEMLELFPECSGNMSLENFSPAWYLLENHQTASFDDLKHGLTNMRRSARTRSEGPIAFVKTNIGAILDCLDSLDTMYEKFSEDDIQRECISSYAVSLMQAKSCADGLFQDVLGRKDKADATRNALNVLQRFKFLFYLPLNIERNIQKGDYNLVINDYVRARSLFADTQVKVFQKVYKEVESRVHAFREMLHDKLMKLPNTLEDQKKLIKYLNHLECKGDPAWECIQNQQQWLYSLLTECKTHHINEPDEPVINQRNSINGAQIHYTRGSRTSGYFGEAGWKFRTPQKVLFVEELTEIMTNNFPDFWKLGHAYMSGNLTMKEEGKNVKSDQTNIFKQMVSSTIKYFSNIVRAAFLPKSLENLAEDKLKELGIWPDSQQEISGAWLPHCVRYVRSCASSLCGLDLPSDSQELIHELAFDMRTNCMFTMLKQAINDVRSLHTKETWVVELDDEFGGTTQLPALFENIVNEAIQHLHEVVVQNRTGEREIFGHRTVQKEATSLCTKLLEAFAPCLEQLAFSKTEQVATSPVQLRYSQDKNTNRDQEDLIPTKDKKLIIMLSNCNHTKQHIIPRLVENLNKYGYVETNKVMQASQDTYNKLDEKLFEAYIEEKSDPIVGTMEPNMYRGHFDWRHCRQPNDVRNYLKEVIMAMIEVHAEVHSISPAFICRVMVKIVDAVVEELSRLIQCVPEFGTNGILQARLEILCLQHTIEIYKSENTITSFKEALEHLPDAAQSDKRKMEELMNKFRTQMKFQLMCFTSDTSTA
ncbi:Exocyst complex component 2 [Mactra antiquata]